MEVYWSKVNFFRNNLCIQTSPTPPFSPKENVPGEWGSCHPRGISLLSTFDRASRQRPADSLGRSESNGLRVILLAQPFDLPGDVKIQNPFHDLVFFRGSFSSVNFFAI